MDRLQDGLQAAGAPEQVTALAERAAADAGLDDPAARRCAPAGDDRVAAPVSDPPLEGPIGVARMLDRLREANLPEQVAALLRGDPAAHVSVEDANGVAILLINLERAGAHDQVTVLADRAAAGFPVVESYGADMAVDVLHTLGTPEQLIVVADRAARHVSLDNPGGVARLLSRLSKVGADEQITVLADRVVAQASVEHPGNAAWLLNALRANAAPGQVLALAAAAAVQASVENPDGVARLLGSLQSAGAPEQLNVLLSRDPAAHAVLSDADDAAKLLDSLQASARTRRSPSWPTGWLGKACLNSSASERTPRISSGLAGRLTAAQPSHGTGAIWTEVPPLRRTAPNRQRAPVPRRSVPPRERVFGSRSSKERCERHVRKSLAPVVSSGPMDQFANSGMSPIRRRV